MASYLDVHIERKDFAHNGVFETVLNDINTHIQEGSTATFFGPSGCGKSTLFRIIAGLDQDFHGRVLLDGTDVTKPSARIGLVTQIDSAYDWCNVAKNIGFSLRYQPHFKAAGLLAHTFGLSDWELARAEIVRIASLVGLHETDLTKYPAQLSGGMRQRMNLGRALAARPDILLLDEPFSALDHESRESLQQLVLKLRDDTRTTLLIVTHDPEEALFLGDQVIVLGSRPGSVHTILEGADPGGSDPNVKYTQEFQRQRRELQTWLSNASNHN